MASPYDFTAPDTEPARAAHSPYSFGANVLTQIKIVHPQATPFIEDHCALALERLIEQFRGKVKLEDLICIFADEIQKTEQEIANVKAFRSIDTSLGQQLDELGALYLETRNAEDDPTFRARLKAFAQIVASAGTGDDLLAVALTFDGGFSPSSIQLIEHHPACLIVTGKVPSGGQLKGEEIGRFLKLAKAGGVCLVFLFEEVRGDLFVWSGESGNGWAEEDDFSVGGIWAEGV